MYQEAIFFPKLGHFVGLFCPVLLCITLYYFVLLVLITDQIFSSSRISHLQPLLDIIDIAGYIDRLYHHDYLVPPYPPTTTTLWSA